MSRLRNRVVLLACLAAAGLSAGSAQAQWWGGWGWGGWPTIYSMDQPPYFALHPPVYYSMPVPRTYGYSPFAYPGFVETPAWEGAIGYAPPAAPATPKMIINPYVEPSSPSPSNGAAPAANQQSRVQVIYPIRQFARPAAVAQSVR
jgi:hypothetical protein